MISTTFIDPRGPQPDFLLVTKVSNRLNKAVGILLWRCGLNSMSQIHDMANGSSLFQNLLRSLLDDRMVRIQDARIQVALHAPRSSQSVLGPGVGNSFASLCHVHCPVQRDHVNSSRCHSFNESSRVLNVDDCWNVRVFGLDLFCVIG
jgi:hypothetical protein